MRIYTKRDVADRFFEHVRVRGDCWMWTGMRDRDGYGRFQLDGKSRLAHRLSLRLAGAIVPSALLVCHTCDNPACVRPEHLWLGTVDCNNKDRARKGRSRNQHIGKTHCPKGHEYDEANTYRYSDGRRGCRTCNVRRPSRVHTHSEPPGVHRDQC